MTMLQDVFAVHELLDAPNVTGADVADEFVELNAEVTVESVDSDGGATDFVTIYVPGSDPDAPTLGVIGRLGGIGARPSEIGSVSDADGAIAAIAAARHLARHSTRGDRLPGDVIITTHVCPDAPTIPHDPVPFMSSPVETAMMNHHEVDDAMDAILTIDATKGNRVHCQRGFAISPTILQGWILRVSEDLLDIQERVTGRHPETLTTTMQDITPYGNDVHHLNSIFQPSTATTAPVVGVATTSETPVAGSATGANYLSDIAEAASFAVETAKDYGRRRAEFYDSGEFDELRSRYGSMTHLQTLRNRCEVDR